MHHSDANTIYSLRSTLIHWQNLFRTLLLHPQTELVDSHHLGIVLMVELDRISDVISMPMRAQHHVDFLKTLLMVGTNRIVHHPGIDENRLAGNGFNVKSRMSQPGNLVPFRSIKTISFESSLSYRQLPGGGRFRRTRPRPGELLRLPCRPAANQ